MRGPAASSAGAHARSVGAALVVAGLAALLLGLVLLAGQADLRDLAALRGVQAEVVDVDEGRRGADHLEVVYDVEGAGRQRARVPYAQQVPRRGPAPEVGDRLPVAYVPGDPGRVRTVTGWRPAYRLPLTAAAVLVPVGLPLLALGVASRRRAGRYEDDGPLPAPVHDPGHGTRIVRSSRGGLVRLAAPLLVLPAVLLLALLLRAAPAPALLLGLAGSLVVVALVVAAAQRAHGRDGVWATDDALAARCGRRLRHLPWDEVLELGLVVRDGWAQVPAARLRHPGGDLTEGDWTTLARPQLGPLAAHLFARRFRALAVERGIPLAEGLGTHDLADRWVARLRRPPARA